MKAQTTARALLKALLADIEAAGLAPSRVAAKAGVDPSQVSRWKGTDIEPRLSSIERLEAAFEKLKAEQAAQL